MNYAESRAMEIKRLSYEQMISLKIYEKNAGRAFFPHEIQTRFSLPPLKATYLIPEIDAAQAAHCQKIRNDFYKEKIYPKYEHLSSLNLDEAHAFDSLIADTMLDFVYSGSKKVSLRESL